MMNDEVLMLMKCKQGNSDAVLNVLLTAERDSFFSKYCKMSLFGGRRLLAATDIDGNSPVLIAAVYGHINVLRVLSEWMPSAISQARNKLTGTTVLHIAAIHGHLECMKYALDQGVPIDVQDVTGRTALHWAAQKNHLECVEELIHRGADKDIINERGLTALDLASQKKIRNVLLSFHSNDGYIPDFHRKSSSLISNHNFSYQQVN